MEVPSAAVSEAMLHGEDRFAVIFEVQGKEKATGRAFDMREVGICTVSKGRIMREEFFFPSPRRTGVEAAPRRVSPVCASLSLQGR